MNTRTSRGRIALAAVASVGASAGWYTVWDGRLATLDEAYAQEGPPPVWVMPVELARSTAVATAVAVLADSTGRQGGTRRSGPAWGCGAPSLPCC